MDYPTVVNIILFALAATMGVLGWLAKSLWDAVQELRLDLGKIQVMLPTSYVAKADLASFMEKIERGLEKIYDKLDGKADKP